MVLAIATANSYLANPNSSFFADPGLGFGKRGAHNLELLARSGELASRLGVPVMVGPSRKHFLLHESVEETILEILVKLSPPAGKPDPALITALTDAVPARRAAAGFVLGRRADMQPQIRKLLADGDERGVIPLTDPVDLHREDDLGRGGGRGNLRGCACHRR